MSTHPLGACKHYEICQLSGDYRDGYCILHFPEAKGKNIPTFQQTLYNHFVAGRCDLRYFYWPAGDPDPDLRKRDFVQVADFRGAVWAGTLNLSNSCFQKGLRFGGERVGQVNLTRAKVKGPLLLEA